MCPSDPPETLPSSRRAGLQHLLAEIPTWDDHMLLHMYRRFGESPLFRVRYARSGPVTPQAMELRAAAAAEIERRGLALPILAEDDAAAESPSPSADPDPS